MSDTPMRTVQFLFGSAAVMTVMAVLFWLQVIELGIEPWRMALVCAMVAVADVVVGIVFLSRIIRR